MKLHNSGLCDYCGKTDTVGHVLINCKEMELMEIKIDACVKLQLDCGIKCTLNDERLFDVISANINRKI